MSNVITKKYNMSKLSKIMLSVTVTLGKCYSLRLSFISAQFLSPSLETIYPAGYSVIGLLSFVVVVVNFVFMQICFCWRASSILIAYIYIYIYRYIYIYIFFFFFCL
jgi:hypothetical protein